MWQDIIYKINEKPSPVIMWRVFAGFLAISAFHLPAFIPMMSGFILYHAIGWATDSLDGDTPNWVAPLITFLLTFGATSLVSSGLLSIVLEIIR